MPSPFPGMDPFLEHPALFPGLHDRLIAYLSEALQARLPAPYFAEINERLWVDAADRSIGPDEDVLRGDQPSPPRQQADGGVRVAKTAAQPIVITVPYQEQRETFLEIRVPGEGGERVVTTIEVLSPTNKTAGPKSRELYLAKQREVLDGQVHLVEIDLLRGGTHTTAVPKEELKKKAPPYDYHVCVHPFDELGKLLDWTVTLEQRLPEVAVPLLPGDGTVAVDLQRCSTALTTPGPTAAGCATTPPGWCRRSRPSRSGGRRAS